MQRREHIDRSPGHPAFPDGHRGNLENLEIRTNAPLGMLSHIQELLRDIPLTIESSGPIDLEYINKKIILSSPVGIEDFSIEQIKPVKALKRNKFSTIIELCEGPIKTLEIINGRHRSTATDLSKGETRSSAPYERESRFTESSFGTASRPRGENGW